MQDKIKDRMADLEYGLENPGYRDAQELSNLDSGYTHVEWMVEKTAREARRLGIPCDPPTGRISTTQALNFLASLLPQIDAGELEALKSKPFLTPPEAARLLGVNEDKVALWIDDPVDPLPAINIAKDPNGKKPRWRISREELNRWLARREAMSTRGR